MFPLAGNNSNPVKTVVASNVAAVSIGAASDAPLFAILPVEYIAVFLLSLGEPTSIFTKEVGVPVKLPKLNT